MLEPFWVTSSWTWTFSRRQKTLWIVSSDARWIDLYWSWGRIYTAWSNSSQQISLNWSNANISENTNVWYHHVVTISNWTLKGYVDWVEKKSGSVTTWLTTTYFRRWQEYNNAYRRQLYGYLKDIVIEDVAWSSQEVSDYFNLTKWDYWK